MRSTWLRTPQTGGENRAAGHYRDAAAFIVANASRAWAVARPGPSVTGAADRVTASLALRKVAPGKCGAINLGSASGIVSTVEGILHAIGVGDHRLCSMISSVYDKRNKTQRLTLFWQTLVVAAGAWVAVEVGGGEATTSPTRIAATWVSLLETK